jgi:FAD/FMN-containing dehydrogenase
MTNRAGVIAERLPSIVVAEGPLSDLADVVIRPRSVDEVREVIRIAGERSLSVRTVGSASSRRMPTTRPDVVITTTLLDSVVAYEPDDLTLVVGAGTTLGTIEYLVGGRDQTAVLVDGFPDRTVGGVVSAGDSGYRRLRYGPTRDRVLGVTLVTGYGEIVKGGGRLVKNVTGYDLPRLVTGSAGSLGIIIEVCLKLWPDPPAKVSVAIDDPTFAIDRIHRPSAVLETETGATVHLEGSVPAVDELLQSLDGTVESGHRWPDPLTCPFQVSVRVAPRSMVEAVAAVRAAGASRFIAQHGVGRVDAGWRTGAQPDVGGLRTRIASLGGIVIVTAWDGTSPPESSPMDRGTAAIQERLRDLFDPLHVLTGPNEEGT